MVNIRKGYPNNFMEKAFSKTNSRYPVAGSYAFVAGTLGFSLGGRILLTFFNSLLPNSQESDSPHEILLDKLNSSFITTNYKRHLVKSFDVFKFGVIDTDSDAIIGALKEKLGTKCNVESQLQPMSTVDTTVNTANHY